MAVPFPGEPLTVFQVEPPDLRKYIASCGVAKRLPTLSKPSAVTAERVPPPRLVLTAVQGLVALVALKTPLDCVPAQRFTPSNATDSAALLVPVVQPVP